MFWYTEAILENSWKSSVIVTTLFNLWNKGVGGEGSWLVMMSEYSLRFYVSVCEHKCLTEFKNVVSHSLTMTWKVFIHGVFVFSGNNNNNKKSCQDYFSKLSIYIFLAKRTLVLLHKTFTTELKHLFTPILVCIVFCLTAHTRMHPRVDFCFN